MATSKVADVECFCAWVGVLGDFRPTLEALLDSAIAVLEAVKVALALIPTNVTDQLKKIQYEAEMAFIAESVSAISAPLSYLIGIARPFADCAPVASVVMLGNNVRNEVLADLTDRQFELQQFILAIEKENLKAEEIQLAIDTMNELRTALGECGTGE
jgi:hypothetical protein